MFVLACIAFLLLWAMVWNGAPAVVANFVPRWADRKWFRTFAGLIGTGLLYFVGWVERNWPAITRNLPDP